MKSSHLIASMGLLIFMVLAKITLAQQKNPTSYPYGGAPDVRRMKEVRFLKTALIFNSRANFSHAQFHSRADFSHAMFDSLADFGDTKFDSLADFTAGFGGPAYFWGTKFHSRVDFSPASFFRRAYFHNAKFHSRVDFNLASFYFRAYFSKAEFDSLADFGGATFDSLADFQEVKLRDKVIFTSTTFNKLNFTNAQLDRMVDFSLATFQDTLFIGTPQSSIAQKYDFTRAYLLSAGEFRRLKKGIIYAMDEHDFETFPYPGAKIVLFGPVELKMQAEKVKFLALANDLDYYAKKDIITYLKENSFEGENFSNARFELDYLFARSTIYQKRSVHFEEHSWYCPVAWVQWLYKVTMGLGYRPFRLLYWVALINLLFAVFYIVSMPRQITGYVNANFGGAKPAKSSKDKPGHFLDTFINAFYFSFMLFFTFRLKGNLLTFFETREKGIVVFHWLLGFVVYIAFLAFSKAGSVLHTLKSLFVG